MILDRINLSVLESHLWESADILRGPVDAADFKTYIFPLLFFKRICDVWDDEYQEIVDETGDEQLAWFPESHRFQIPEDCHWNNVRTKANNVGDALQRAMREIEILSPARGPKAIRYAHAAAWTLQPRAAQVQHDFCLWTGGHLIEPKEQNTQQSPGFGRSKARQLSHS